MKGRNRRKLGINYLVLTIIFTMLFPSYGAAATQRLEKKENIVSNESNSLAKNLIAQQKAALAQGPVLHPSLKNLKGNQEVAVIVELSEYPVALVKGINKQAGKSTSKTEEKAIQQKVITQQQKFKTNLSAKGIAAKVGFTYNYTFNGLALKLKASDVAKLLSVDGVKLVEPDAEKVALGEKVVPGDQKNATMNTSNPFLEVPSVWGLGYQGQGVKVAVLDTGIDYNHPEFEGVYKGGYNFIDQSNSANYARTRAADDPYETTPLDRPGNKAEFNSDGSAFYTEHGTHVAGTIAAQGKNPFGIKGLAPKVDLYAYRVLGAYGSGANSGIIAAIDKAAQEKMDIINLSLGGSNNTQTSSDAIAINNAALVGVTAVIATGNDGPNRGTIGSPGVAAFAISVANSTVPETTKAGQATVTAEGTAPTPYNMNLMGWKFGTEPSDLLTGTYDVVAVPNFGVDADYTGLDVNGKVALVSRGGGIAFVDKIAAAKKAGAVAAIIHNNTGTTPAGIFLGDSFHFIPTFDMSTTDGTALRTALATKKATVTFGNFTSAKTAGDDINSSSSRGPANPNFDLKPDVSAPGTNIMSSVPAYGKDYPNADYSESYDRFTGTSMATPHVSGIAALLKSEHPDWTPFDLKVAISNTSKQLDVTKYDVFSQGPGRVQPLKAATTEALAYSTDQTSFSGKTYQNIKGTVTFGNVATSTTAESKVVRDIVVKNLTGEASDYTVTVQTTKAATGTLAAAKVSVDQSSFNLAASGEQALKVTLDVPKGSGTSGNEILGYIHITNGKTKLILPFAGNFAPPTGLKSYSIDSKVISPNGDGKLDSTTLRYEFHNRQYTTYIEVWDAFHQEAGEYGDGYLGYLLASSSTTVGAKTLAFNGQYTDWGTSKKVLAADGVYTIDITTLNQAQTAVAASGWVGPIFVKTKAPTIVTEASYTTNTTKFDLSGSLNDSYIDWEPGVEEVFEEGYDINSKLKAKYQLTNSKGETQVGTTAITLNQDGSFNISIDGLTEGDNKVKIMVDDDAQNSASKEITVTRKAADPEPNPDAGKGQLLLDGQPLANITFSVYTAGANQVWYDLKSDTNGNFTHNLPDGDYKIDGVWAAPTWYPLNGSFTIKNGLVNGNKLVINANDYQVPIDPAKWNIAGKLTKNGDAFANITFSVHTLDGANWYDTRTDAKGNFAVKVPDGTYQLDGIWEAAKGKWHVLNQQFTVKDGKLVGGDQLLVNVTSVDGNVTGTLKQGDAPLANTIFSVHTTTGVWYDAQTDANGNFKFSLPDGSYKLEGIWVDKDGKWYELQKEFTVSGSLTLDVTIPTAPVKNVTGVLTKGTEALGNVVFSFHSTSGDQWFNAKTAADGSFGLVVPNGSYQLDGIWLESESKWYVLNLKFSVEDGKLVGMDQLRINLSN
ncbi:minor extracellular serine protease Vpr [Bacillus sp. SORGH_AS 510]|uniref:S8 family serine peptidase n=1 Tax=Bacillus sp. SORGH_AS_0510 TaxID=3041771 RepID=UPI0027854CDB|nr:S8 family serine peptidase [Bacillus sp. SORGH_AS_0510]MDQ1144167.1 minor extracellular serine protease Vpr [Bacillus sp. SORGH_AS_0510]